MKNVLRSKVCKIGNSTEYFCLTLEWFKNTSLFPWSENDVAVMGPSNASMCVTVWKGTACSRVVRHYYFFPVQHCAFLSHHASRRADWLRQCVWHRKQIRKWTGTAMVLHMMQTALMQTRGTQLNLHVSLNAFMASTSIINYVKWMYPIQPSLRFSGSKWGKCTLLIETSVAICRPWDSKRQLLGYRSDWISNH